jgi:hypothetical protein
MQNYAAEREEMLTHIHAMLKDDARILAMWLLGSYARGDQDAYSDLDICVVVSRNESRLIEDWSAFVLEFGELVNVHEAPQNAPPGGTMASTLYSNGVTIDWMLIPQESAVVPIESRLVFEKEPFPRQAVSVLSSEEKEVQLEDRLTFFWMMAAVTAKTILREDGVRFHVFLNVLFWTSEEIADLIADHPRPYLKDSGLGLQVSQSQQADTLINLCSKVTVLTKSNLERFSVIKNLLALRN